uniref:Transmembrane protein 245 n=1 Tax=Strigamia maritima TaxID=126957 RepID=T1JEG2_STRMM
MSAPSSSTDSRSPFDNVLNFVPQGHEKALKHAFYNAAALAFLLIGVAAAGAVYIVMGPFLRPLLWAVLCGSVLHPFKQKLTGIVRQWIQSLKSTGTPLTIGIIAFPIGIMDRTAETVGGMVVYYAKTLITVSFVLVTNAVAEETEEELPSFTQTAWAVLCGSHERKSSETTSVTVSTASSTAVKEESKSSVRPAPTPRVLVPVEEYKTSNMYLWGLVWACGIVQFYYHLWLLPLFAFPIWYFIIKRTGQYFGIWSCLRDKFNRIQTMFWKSFEERKDAIFPVPVRGLIKLISGGDGKILSYVDSAIDTLVSLSTIVIVLFCTLFGTIFFAVQIHAESMHLVQVTSSLINRTVVNNPELQALLPEGLGEMVDSMFDNAYVYGREWSANMVKNLIGEADEAKALHIEKQVHELVDRLYHTWTSSNENNVPSRQIGQSWNNLLEGLTAPGLFDLSKITDFVKENIGTFMSVLEGVWSVLKGNISLVMNAVTAVLSLVFGGGTALLNFFINCIVFMTALFYLLASSGKQYKVVELIGKVTPAGSGGRFGMAAEEAINGVFAASFKMAFFYGMWTWLMHTLFGVKMVYIPSGLFGSGTECIQLLRFPRYCRFPRFPKSDYRNGGNPITEIEEIRLPKSRKSDYRNRGNPITEIEEIRLPKSRKSDYRNRGNPITEIEEIRLPKSRKSDYRNRIAMAALFGAVPFLGTYWAAVPAVLELWLIQDSAAQAIIMFTCQLLPMSFVDTAIYSEIKGGGHPYLTGLAIAGGIFCLGVEGALMGPILLCCLFVVVNMCGSMMQQSPVGEPRSRPGSSRYYAAGLFKRTTSIY